MESQSKIDPFSLMTTPVILLDRNREVSLGTGFLFATSDSDG
jgi:hypothetical protein